jgi:hypothetical protein
MTLASLPSGVLFGGKAGTDGITGSGRPQPIEIIKSDMIKAKRQPFVLKTLRCESVTKASDLFIN